MAKTQTFTVSIVGVFLLFATLAGLLAWIGPFVAPNVTPFKPRIGWSSAQFTGFAVGTGVAVGIWAAAALLLIRRVLPASLRSHIVWVPPDMLDRAKLKQQGVELAVAIAIILGIVLVIGYGTPRFWGDFRGMTEAEVREKLGEPFRDSREAEDRKAAEYTLGWYQGGDTGLFLTFKNGAVVSQKRGSR